MKRILPILLLCLALLTAGCSHTAPQSPAPAAPTAGTVPIPSGTGTDGSDGAGTAPTEPLSTDPPTVPTGSADPARQELGGPSFTLSGQTFTMGEAPDRLLAFLGEPEESFSYGDSLYDGTDYLYHYKDIWVSAFQPTGSDSPVLNHVYFITDRYAPGGLRVGDTAGDLRRAVALPETAPGADGWPRFCYQDFRGGTEIGGYGYLLDPVQETPGDTNWAFLFDLENDSRIPGDGDPILCIKIYYRYPFPTY